MKHIFLCCFVVLGLFPASVFAQQGETELRKFALVIGNGAYTGLSRLTNPVNDANDVSAALVNLGFTVDKVLNGNQEQMDSAVMRLKNRLSSFPDSYGFFFYAGHGVQSGGENYLIPVDANIPGENYLRSRAVSVQLLLDELNDSRNTLNVIVLDACRDNPFGWSRSGSRGLAMVSRQPADSIIVYATSAGQQASDGEGRNGLFTSQFLPHLMTEGLEVGEVFKRTGADVALVSSNRQVPAIYSQFFKTAYLGGASDSDREAAYVPGSMVRPEPLPVDSGRFGNKNRETEDREKRLWSLGASLGTSFNDPWLVGTVRGTIAPYNNSFFELGIDFGFISGADDAELNSFYPFGHYAFFRPYSEKFGLYAGAGLGYLTANYSFPKGDKTINTFAADIIAGAVFFNMLDISCTIRTNFKNGSSKISAGYIYRF